MVGSPAGGWDVRGTSKHCALRGFEEDSGSLGKKDLVIGQGFAIIDPYGGQYFVAACFPWNQLSVALYWHPSAADPNDSSPVTLARWTSVLYAIRPGF